MGKQRGFLEFDRMEPGFRDVNVRLKDFDPVELRLFDSEINTQAARCMDCGMPFCHGYGCPLSNVIPELNDLVYNHRWQEAADLLLSTNNFPEFTASICPALCEKSCVLALNDEPVTIRQIELAIIEKAFETGYLKARPPTVRQAKKIAVVGSGPAGLVVADDLNKNGYNVVVYDREKHAGGILRYGIPDFKLEKNVLDRRIQLMRDEGIDFECGVSVGEDISFKYLKDRFDAVCLAGGSRKPRDLDVPGRELYGIHFAMEYLTQQNKRLMREHIEPDMNITAKEKNVVIIGGGDTGSDCLGTALRQGAKTVCQLEILPRPPDSRPENTPWPVWPNVYKETSSNKEGGERKWCVSTVGFAGKSGYVEKVHCVEMNWMTDENGKTFPKKKDGTEFEIEAQLVLLALGFTGSDLDKLMNEIGLIRNQTGSIKLNNMHMTSIDGVFSAGDMCTGQSLVVKALADGKKCADGIICYLEDGGSLR